MALETGDGKNPASAGKKDGKRSGEKEVSEWEVWTSELWITGKEWGGQRDSWRPLTPLYSDAKSLWALLLACIVLFCSANIRKYCVPMRVSCKLQPRSVSLGSAAPSELQIMFIIARDLILYWCFESFLLQWKWKHMEVDHWCQESGQDFIQTIHK